MKIIISEEKIQNSRDKSMTFVFRIIGERKKNSLEVPVYEKHLNISKAELTAYEKNILERKKHENAISVFNQFYKDNF